MNFDKRNERKAAEKRRKSKNEGLNVGNKHENRRLVSNGKTRSIGWRIEKR